jgi:hypothetical protein
MKIERHIKQIRKLLKRLRPLTPWTIVFAGLTLLIFSSASALVIQHFHAKPATTSISTISNSGNNAICVQGEQGCPEPATSPTTSSNSTPSTTPPLPAKASGSVAATDCSSVEAEYDQEYSSALKSAQDIASFQVGTSTPTEISNQYNQASQNAYNQAIQGIKVNGCTPYLTLSTMSAATVPGDTAPVIPTCNTALEASYEISYESQYEVIMEQESSDIQSLRAQLGTVGADNGTGWAEVPSIVAQRYAPQLDAIKNTLNSELASINCPGD